MSKSKSSKYRGKTLRRRGQSWQVDFGTVDGKRKQVSYPSKEDAKRAIEEQAELERQGEIDRANKRVAVYDLSDKQRMDIFSALGKLPRGTTLTDAVDYYLEHTRPAGESVTVTALLERYLKDKRKSGRRPGTLEDIAHRVGRFAKRLGETAVHEISSHDIERWMDQLKWGPSARDKNRTALMGFFNYALKHEYVRQNPVKKLERPIIDRKTPKAFTPAQVERLMRAAQKHRPAMVPYLAIGLFAGLRPTEVKNLNWHEINLKSRTIRVLPEVSKTRDARAVDISDNLLEWLAPFRRKSGEMHFSRDDIEHVRKKAKVKWIFDGLRHSYGSYHVAMHQDAGATALQMGHKTTDVLFRHYRGLVTREEAEIYWSIRPADQENVIRMDAVS